MGVRLTRGFALRPMPGAFRRLSAGGGAMPTIATARAVQCIADVEIAVLRQTRGAYPAGGIGSGAASTFSARPTS